MVAPMILGQPHRITGTRHSCHCCVTAV